ncbi:hypothetical protein ACN20G_28265 (plasmid) [Streptomyces sp. BI20]|uniref:hypothetical protein n=1 Tax=Streptomyces sp. BI20 TaxID=3403460 RepID=UPI003C78BEAC
MACRLCAEPGLHVLCPGCTSATADTVHALPGLCDQLAAHLPPARGRRARTGPRAHAPLPAQLEALALRAVGGIPTTLATWAHHLVHARNLDHPVHARTTPLHHQHAATIARHLPWAAAHLEAAATLAREVTELAARARRVIDPPETLRTELRCPVSQSADGTPCAGPLSVDTDAMVIRCYSCKAEWPQDRWLHLGHVLAT